MKNTLIRIATALTGLVAFSALTGCHLIVVGDSITWGAQDAIRIAAHDDPSRTDDVHVDGIIGRGPYTSPMVAGSDSFITAIRGLAPVVKENGVLVIQDGAADNDAALQRRFMREVNGMVRPDVCIVWVLPWDANRPDTDATIADVIYAEAPAHRHAIANWHDIAAADNDGLTQDGLHVNAAGAVALADEMMAATLRCK